MAILEQSSADFALTNNFQSTHILGASHGHLCDSVIFLLGPYPSSQFTGRYLPIVSVSQVRWPTGPLCTKILIIFGPKIIISRPEIVFSGPDLLSPAHYLWPTDSFSGPEKLSLAQR